MAGGEDQPASNSNAGASSSPPATSLVGQNLLPGQHWVDAANELHDDDDSDSALSGVDGGSSTASLSSSILRYRTINGRTFHSESGDAQYWAANDNRQNESMDIHHHLLTLALGDKLYQAPLEKGKIKRVVDIGTGTGIWAIDFADENPAISVIGTDLSPIQPGWVPPNLEFLIEDCTQLPWTFDSDEFDYVHIRYLLGSIVDWPALYQEAYRVCAPGGWLESHEGNTKVQSYDGSLPEDSALNEWTKIFDAAEEGFGRPFRMVDRNIQKEGIEAAGFVDVSVHDILVPMCGWSSDPRLKEMGEFYHLVLKTDMEGYVHLMANQLFGWTNEQVFAYCAKVKQELRSGKGQPYYMQRVVCGRKPE